MQSQLQIRESLKQSVGRLIIQYRIERMSRRLAWVEQSLPFLVLFCRLLRWRAAGAGDAGPAQ